MSLRTRITKSAKGLANPMIAAILVALSVVIASAQDGSKLGSVAGSVLDTAMGGTVSRALVTLRSSDDTNQIYSIRSDVNGRFVVSDVPAGFYTLSVTAEFYQTARVEELQVSEGLVSSVDVPLNEDMGDVIELGEFVVKATALQGSDIVGLTERQNSPAASDLIGSEMISRLGLSDAADALGKVTGVSITDGKYMVVRGLSDRYNSTTVNGSTVPSADPDRRAVQLDQFPSSVIDSITTVKTYTPDKSGNFTGGYVDIKTKSVPDSGFLGFKLGVTYNESTSFRDILSTSGGGDDWLGKDDGTRSLSELQLELAGFGNVRDLDAAGRQALSEISRSFSQEMEPIEKTAPLSHSASVAFGDRYYLTEDVNGPTLGVVGSVSNKRSISYYEDGQINRFELDFDLYPTLDLTERKGVEKNEWGTLLNVAFRPNALHEIGINTTFNQSGEDVAISREGLNYETVGTSSLFRVQNIHYTERTLSVAQLFGKHTFEDMKNLKIDWIYSDSTSNQEEPDYRIFYDAIPDEGDAAYRGNFAAPRRYWRDLQEGAKEYKVDFTLPLGRNSSELKFGVQNTQTDRDFNEFALSYEDNAAGFKEVYPEIYVYDGEISKFLNDEFLSLSPNGQVMRYLNFNPGEVPYYNGEQEIDATYLMYDFKPLEKWRFIVGARYEKTDITVQSFDASGDPKGDDGNIQTKDWLPALNVVYKLNSKSNFRFAATKTLARPNFRELSPFGSFDNVGGETFVGNPALKRSLISNYDLRYEWFPADKDVVAVTFFTKTITDPIELNFNRGELTYVNVDSADVKGLELEARKGFELLGDDIALLSVGGNLSYVKSEVVRSEAELQAKRFGDPNVSLTRDLQGQSELVGNADVSFDHYKKGTTLTLAYTYTGERRYSISKGAFPDIFEAPSNQLDFIWSQRLKQNFSMKFALKNLLDDKEKKFITYSDVEEVYSEHGSGLSVSLGFSYDLR